MCLIIDSCVFSAVFNPRDEKHPQFRPVLGWIVRGKGKIVYGGSTYKKELKNAKRYLGLFLEFKRSGKVVEIDDREVDNAEAHVKRKVNQRKFNDAHLAAIVVVSRCAVIATNDHAAIPFLRRTDLYPRGLARPRMYTSARNQSLLSDANIVEICIPATRVKNLETILERLR